MALNYLYKMTSTKIKELQPKCNLAFIPLGPTEVHGPHLPLMTDFRSGLELCERAARKLQEEGIESIIATPGDVLCSRCDKCISWKYIS